jgi:hypothetical protein
MVMTVKLWNLGYMMMLTRDVINLLKCTTSTCIVGCLVFSVVNGGLRLICLGYMAGTYFSFIDVLLEAYLLEILVHTFGIWLGYIFGYVVGELMR